MIAYSVPCWFEEVKGLVRISLVSRERDLVREGSEDRGEDSSEQGNRSNDKEEILIGDPSQDSAEKEDQEANPERNPRKVIIPLVTLMSLNSGS